MEEEIQDNIKTTKMDLKNRVMGKIKAEDIQIRTPLFLLARKVGLQSVLMLAIFGGGLLLAMMLYVVKKMGAFAFLKLGVPGIKVFLLALPYDYIALLLISILVVNYIARKLDLAHAFRGYLNISALALLVVAVFLGGFFAFRGGENVMQDWHKNRNVPKTMAVTGRVVSLSGSEVTIEEQGGRVEMVTFQKDKPFPYSAEYAIGKVLRAVGERDKQNPGHFYAEEVSCCETE
ncbi:MAG: hypothetical protein WC238_01900 [Parcubacteria group bacterium]|jgi:hypothetical protein